MCAIVGSYNLQMVDKLYKLNSYRGELSYSLAGFDVNNNKVRPGVIFTGDGKLPQELLVEYVPPYTYYVAHTQAPTTDTNNIHPAIVGENMLWHNGIIKQKTIPPNTWDTRWLLDQILDYGWSVLSRVDGTFACCMYHNGDIFFFRNEISPLFIDNDFNVSSTKFKDSKPLEPNIVWQFDVVNKTLHNVAQFETFENPYYME